MPVVLMALGCGVGNAQGDAAHSSLSLSVGYASSYKFEDQWTIQSKGLSELTYKHALGTHVFLAPSFGFARYTGNVSTAVSSSWNVSVDLVPVGFGLGIKTGPTRRLSWQARESILLIYYHWQSEFFPGESGSDFPQFEHRKEVLLGLKMGGGAEQRLGAHGVLGLGVDYFLSEDLDEDAEGRFAAFPKEGLRQFQPYLSMGWAW